MQINFLNFSIFQVYRRIADTLVITDWQQLFKLLEKLLRALNVDTVVYQLV